MNHRNCNAIWAKDLGVNGWWWTACKAQWPLLENTIILGCFDIEKYRAV
jgi:hypothetical protein